MISCTEFIPSYSELFTYLEDHYGAQEVRNFWKFLFAPTGKSIPLINYVKKDGIRGCFNYWAHSLNEEAADFTMYLNEKRGFFQIVMHKCPSKGRLLKLKDEIGIEPYRDYCLHCDNYRLAVSQVGLEYIYNFTGVERAACSILIYDPKIFDGQVIIDEDTEIMDRKASDNEYFHRDFHSSLNNGMEYVGEKYGAEVLKDYLQTFTRHVYAPVIQAIAEKGIKAIEEKIADTYHKEKADDVLEITYSGDTMKVAVAYCPGVKHLRSTGRDVSKWYRYSTDYVMETLAEAAGYSFTMDSYDEETGKANYHFDKV